MSIFAGARKCDLKILAEELGEKVDDSHKLKYLKKINLASKEYDEECAKEWLNTIINERKAREENELRNEEIEEGSSCCLLKVSVTQKLKPAVNKLYSFGNQKMPALTSIGRIKADIEVDNAKAESISIYVAPDDAQSVDLIIGRTWLDFPHIAYAKIGKRVHIRYVEDELFRNFPIDENVNPVCLKRLETAHLESESLQTLPSKRWWTIWRIILKR
ncbi:hypothetical protein AVEN_234288-1 [Araneus ventricosus]|uniref:Uncharacterized protein n=1 Tax=Araneus ventricosus TaxID=182803 RepID=A0A4Y2AAJ5_ARAVE|nr:hypothetical protein AVEN_234288-1 [Araneus ventricosus]